MHDAAIPDVDFRRSHQPFADIDVKRPQAADKQKVDVSRHGLRADHQRRGKAGGVQKRRLLMREHGPEPLQRLRGNARAKKGNIALQVGADEILTPRIQSVLVSRPVAAVSRTLSGPIST